MSILRKATENTQSDWTPVPEGVWRWRVGIPDVTYSEQYQNWRVRFPLSLTDSEKERLGTDYPGVENGAQQSTLTSYTTGLSLGFVQRDGTYKSTKLVDFLAACFGTSNAKAFRNWIASGGGVDLDDGASEAAQANVIKNWLRWFEDLEVYGTITHQPDSKNPDILWSRFAGPLPVGSLPGQKDDAYQALGRGKLRALIAESSPGTPARPSAPMPQASVIASVSDLPRGYDEIFGAEDAA